MTPDPQALERRIAEIAKDHCGEITIALAFARQAQGSEYDDPEQGYKRIGEIFASALSPTSEPVKEWCEECEGSGYVGRGISELEQPCPACQGNGYVVKLREKQPAGDAMELINQLRADEGDAVTLICDNPDFGGPNSLIECSGDWTRHLTRRFEGDSLLDCLQKAALARTEAQQ